jgi:hypothetical protein
MIEDSHCSRDLGIPLLESKKPECALERLAATQGVSGIVDRLRIKPAMAMSDDGILDHLRKAYYDEPSFRQLS